MALADGTTALQPELADSVSRRLGVRSAGLAARFACRAWMHRGETINNLRAMRSQILRYLARSR